MSMPNKYHIQMQQNTKTLQSMFNFINSICYGSSNKVLINVASLMNIDMGE